MATVPTLTVNSIDQTDYIHAKTLGFRLKTLDFTLIDPATDPALHNVVSLDEPEWHGRVSTIESTPFKAANGDDHRYVKVTATNKHVAPDDTAPFGLSDTPDYATTFPYKDPVFIHTLADQTDLATAEFRVQATIYEPGIIPGMTVFITNAAESLTTEPVIVTEMTVSWLRDDTPEFRLEFSDTGVPPVTLGGLISDATCDCVPFTPCVADYQLESELDKLPQLFAGFPNHGNGQAGESSDFFRLFEGATYELRYTVHHIQGIYTGSNGLSAMIADIGGGPIGSSAGGTPGTGISPYIYMGDAGGSCSSDFPYIPNDIVFATTNYTVSGYSGVGYVDATAYLSEASCVSGDSFGATLAAEAIYIEGPDPRFEDIDPCEDVTPHSGQRIAPESFTGDGSNDTSTLTYPYMSGTIELFVEGVDWTDLVTETDPDAGEFSVAYPYPLATDPHPNVFVHYRYP